MKVNSLNCKTFLNEKILKRSMKNLIILLAFAFTMNVAAQEQPNSTKIKWYTIQEAEKLIKESPKPMFIDTYTEWCGWCKKMDKDTFTNPVIAEILNSKFYPVKFDAEQKETISFMGKTFVNDGKSGKAHQLAVALLQGQLSYPTVVFLTAKDGKVGVTPVPGYREPKDLELLLSYFSDNKYTSTSWEDFQKSFVGKIK
jgi:thioredoxin-related protein